MGSLLRQYILIGISMGMLAKVQLTGLLLNLVVDQKIQLSGARANIVSLVNSIIAPRCLVLGLISTFYS